VGSNPTPPAILTEKELENGFSFCELHRHFKKYVPNCLQVVFNDRIEGMVQIFGMTAKDGGKPPSEYWDYIRERDRKKKQD
jgi:hypothetical protein